MFSLVCAAGMGLSPGAQAITYDFGTIHTSSGTPGGTPPWATLNVIQNGAGVLKFRLEAVSLLSGEFISIFEYNVAGGAFSVIPGSTAGGVDPNQGSQGGFNYYPGGVNDANLTFNADVNFPPPPGSSPWKFTAGEWYEWEISRSGLLLSDLQLPMMIHIQGISGGGSAKIIATPRPGGPPGTPVPDGASTVLLLGAAFTGLSMARKYLSRLV
jgi:hypothetical protein